MKKTSLFLASLFLLTSLNADDFDSYPYDKTIKSLISADSINPLSDASFRCAAVMNILIDTGYAEGEGIFHKVERNFNSFYSFALSSYAMKQGKSPSQALTKNAQEKKWLELDKEFTPIWSEGIDLDLRRYADWMNSTGVTDKVLKNKTHPWTIDQESCFTLGEKLAPFFGL